MSECPKCGGSLDTGMRCQRCGCDTISSAIEPRKGIEFPKADPSVDRIVALTECGGAMYLATERHVYIKEGDRWVPMTIERPEGDDANWWKGNQ